MSNDPLLPRFEAQDNNDALIRRYHARIDEVLLRVIGPVGTKICLLDVPVHKNAGDTLIWEGEIETFNRIGYQVIRQDSARAPLRDISSVLPADAVVVLHGGGNFGDLWPRHQKYREKIANDYLQHRIVFLSQSVYFKDEKLAEASNTFLSAHPDLTLLVRDRVSLDKASRLLPNVRSEYCLDMAFGNELMQRKGEEHVDVVALDRDDVESTGTLDVPTDLAVLRTDWRQGFFVSVAWLFAVAIHMTAKTLPVAISKNLQWLLSKNLTFMRSLTINSAVKTISSGRVLLTNRLHAQVLAGLLGVPSVVVDNNYGKIKPIFEEYGSKLGSTVFADSNDAALRAVKEFLVR